MANLNSVLVLDDANVYADAVGPEHGLGRDEVAALAGRLGESHARLEERRGRDVGFAELPYDAELAARVKQVAGDIRARCDNFVVLGIGGSALGAIAMHGALNHPFHNLLAPDHPARLGAPRLFVLDNVDPALMAGALDLIEPELERTVFNVITKSGSTAETMSQFLLARDLLRRRGLDPAKHIVLTTDPDPERSLLRKMAAAEGYVSLPVPPNVGGRFSVLSAVGLLSAAVAGIDVDALLAGAAAMDACCRTPDLDANPAARYAAIQYLFYGKGKPISVLMPYGSALCRLADWYCQLWAESLGKREDLEGNDIFVGPTPVGAVGVTDQHSVMQLFQDGPFDKVLTLIEVEDATLAGTDVPICTGESEDELAYLARSKFGKLLSAELSATRCALRDKHRPNLTLRVPRVDAAVVGELFMFFEQATAYSGGLYNVNAFVQPGVELGKQYTYGLMGRAGYAPPAGA
jgi:glucose-6-phosphate isomerase